MLVLTRMKNQKITIGDEVSIVVTAIRGGRVSIGIEAPETVIIRRGEIKRVEITQAEITPEQQPPTPTPESNSKP